MNISPFFVWFSPLISYDGCTSVLRGLLAESKPHLWFASTKSNTLFCDVTISKRQFCLHVSTLLLFLFFVSRQTWKHISLWCTCLELNTLLAFFTSTLQRVKCSTSFFAAEAFWCFWGCFLCFWICRRGDGLNLCFSVSISSSEEKVPFERRRCEVVFFFVSALQQSCQNNMRRWRVEQQEEDTCKDFILSVVVEFKIQMQMYIYVHMPTLFCLFFLLSFLLRPVQMCSLLQLLLAML